jgi:hypothetical protein
MKERSTRKTRGVMKKTVRRKLKRKTRRARN